MGQHAADHRQLHAARPEGWPAHRVGCLGRDLRAAAVALSSQVLRSCVDGRQGDSSAACAARQRAHRPAARPLGRAGRILPAGEARYRRNLAYRRSLLPGRVTGRERARQYPTSVSEELAATLRRALPADVQREIGTQTGAWVAAPGRCHYVGPLCRAEGLMPALWMISTPPMWRCGARTAPVHPGCTGVSTGDSL